MNIPDDAIETLTVEDIYNTEKYDLSTMEIDNVFQMLNARRVGLTDQEVNKRLEKFGYNRFEYSGQNNVILRFLLFLWNPLSWVMEVAAVIALALSIGGGQPTEWEISLTIVLLLLVNATIGFIEQRNAGNTVKTHMQSIVPEAKVRRNDEWKVIEAAELVPGDMISFRLGDVIPADGRIIAAHGGVSVDQAALTGESLHVSKSVGDEILSGSICTQGEAEAIVISTGLHTFFGRIVTLVRLTSNGTGHLQIIISHLKNFSILAVMILIVAEILVMYPGFRYNYRRGTNNILVLYIGGISITTITVLAVIFAISRRQLSKHKAIITYVTVIEELAAVTILCLDKTGTLTLNKLVIDKATIKKYADIEIDDIIHYAAIVSRTENQDAIDACITEAYGDVKKIREGIEELEFKPFDPTSKRTEITYRIINDGSVHRISKGMSHAILDLCTRNKTNEQIKQFDADVDELARRGLRALAVAIEDVSSEDEGNGFKLVGLLPIYDPPRSDAKETIERALELGVKVKMITGDQLAIAKETGRRLGLGDNMFLFKTLKDGPPPESGYKDVDDLVLHADGFAGVYPDQKYEIVERLQNMGHMIAMIGDGVNDVPALAKANVGVAVADASDAARATAGIVLTEPSLSVIIDAILVSRQIFQRMRNYVIYNFSMIFRTLVTFSILVFAFKFDFPVFMIIVLAILNDGAILAISRDRGKPSPYPTCWNLSVIFINAIIYGIYLAASTIVFFAVVVKTSFFQEKFGVDTFIHREQYENPPGWNDPKLHSIIYLQVSTISQALIFVIRSRGFFFTERPSIILVVACALAQLIATLIAVYANWGFTDIQGCGWHWAGIVWIWNIVWFFPLDFLKFALRAYFNTERSTEAQITTSTNSPASYRSTNPIPLH